MRIDYVVDDPGWVQGARRGHLERHIPGLELDMRTPASFARRWRWLRRRSGPVYFASWRIAASLREPLKLSDEDLGRFMVSVTSHYNLGGGLAPETALRRGADPDEEFRKGVETLRSFAVVTVNSRRLWDLLADHVPDLLYVPNGVDHELFTPPAERRFDPSAVRVAWVGKVKAAKNHDVVRAAERELAADGFRFEVVAHDKGGGRELLSPEQLRDLYRRSDVYLCTSWHEGTPNPALEAAACGVPLVTTAVGNMPELVRDGATGWFVEPDAESVVAALRRVQALSEPDYLAMSAGIRADVERDWTWREAAGRYREAFDRLAAPEPVAV